MNTSHEYLKFLTWKDSSQKESLAINNWLSLIYMLIILSLLQIILAVD